MCLLERVLGIPHFYSYARQAFSRMSTNPNTVRAEVKAALLDGLADDDYEYLIDEEAQELSLVSNVQYHNTVAYYGGGACTMVNCDD